MEAGEGCCHGFIIGAGLARAAIFTIKLWRPVRAPILHVTHGTPSILLSRRHQHSFTAP